MSASSVAPAAEGSATVRTKPSAALPSRALRRKRRREAGTTLSFLAPWLIGSAFFFGYPLLATVYFSFTHFDLLNPPTWVGFRNWHYVFNDYPDFYKALKNTMWFVVAMVTAQTIFGLSVALLITKIKTGAGFFRTCFYLPYLAPPVASTIGFVYLLNPGTGPVNDILSKVGIHAPDWFHDPDWARPALTLLAVWGVGNLMVIFLAALLDVPKEQYEAAELDGARAIARFRFVTWPNITPVVLFAVITGIIYTMQYYTQAIIAGEIADNKLAAPGQDFSLGYPQGSTLTLPQLVYGKEILNFDTGSACVIALVLFALSMVFTAILLRRKSGFMAGEE
jgi:multiple sugar transport system permease protein